ncbi:hypothetical protein RISK_001169 [Rhodopirellula islandica]|uniref:Uncharacterized protein n=1 Tax=Rhodopirellula islandica TaxID=595434 RepID=A0A0J1BJX6_RHOIS|nr:hypothetical protein RISK_001169 [Rhodopirellula islandica]
MTQRERKNIETVRKPAQRARHTISQPPSDLENKLSRSAGMIGHNHVSRLGVSPGCA